MKGKRIFISFDFEGLAGITSWSDVDKKASDYKRQIMLEQLRFFLRGLTKDDVFLVDSHASGDNIPWEITYEFPNIELVSGGIRKHYMMYGIDDSFDFVVFFGYHAGVGTLEANMDHTYSSSSIYNIWINGIEMNEALINSAFAGLYDVPIACIVGDDKVVEQTRVRIPNALYVSTKESIGRHSAVMKPMKTVSKELEEVSKKLSESPKETFDVFKFEKPIEMIVEFSDTVRTDLVSSMPLVQRIDGRKVKIVHEDYEVIFEALLAMTYICAAAKVLQ